MNDDTSSRRLGHRIDKILVERSIFVWTHIVLGALSGSAFVGAVIISLGGMSSRTGRGSGSVIAIIIFVGAVPYILSCWRNIDRKAETATRAIVFAFGLVGISILVNVTVVWILITHYSALVLFLIYSAQTNAFLFLGNLLLEPGPNDDEFDW